MGEPQRLGRDSQSKSGFSDYGKSELSWYKTLSCNSPNDAPIQMKLQTLKDLYVHQLKALYSAEEQILETLPRMIQAAANAQLAAAFQAHLEQTKVQANRLEKLLERHNQSTRGPRDKAMEGVLADSAELLKGQSDQGVRDLGLIAAAQRVEHYEMAGYGSARTYAEMLDDTEGACSLQNTLSEETETDQKLAGVAKSVIKAIFS